MNAKIKFMELVNMNVIERLIKDFESKSYVQIASFSMIGDCDYIVTYKTLFSEWKEKRFKKIHIELFV